jgi:predicted HAD superfamily hydrolase
MLDREEVSKQVISFDFFDTLFLRTCGDAEQVFSILADRFDIPDFPKLRKIAQTKAFTAMHLKNNREISIRDIYQELPGHPITFEDEIEVESEVCIPNPLMTDFYKSCINSGAIVVITSDMYLESGWFKEILEKFGLPLPSKFLISSTQQKTKRDFGELYDDLLTLSKEIKTSTTHIGDNYKADIEKATDKGILACHYVFSDLDFKPRILGREVFGPFLKAYAINLHNSAIGMGIEHLFFASRDTYLLQKVYNQVVKDSLKIPNSYFPTSRTAAFLSDQNNIKFGAISDWLIVGSENQSFSEIFQKFGLRDWDESVFRAASVPLEVPLGKVHPSMRTEIIKLLYPELVRLIARNARGKFHLLRSLGLETSSHVGLVDLGWMGSSLTSEISFFRNSFASELSGFYLTIIGSNRKKSQYHSAIPADKFRAISESLYSIRNLLEGLLSENQSTVIGYESSSQIKEGPTIFRADSRSTHPYIEFLRSEIEIGILEYLSAADGHFPDFISSAKMMIGALQMSSANGRFFGIREEDLNYDDWSRSSKLV